MTRPLHPIDKKRKRPSDTEDLDEYEEFAAMKKLKLTAQEEYVLLLSVHSVFCFVLT